MPNRLASETSPYLRQHAENPVDWYPWGPAALARSKAENKPILLSIGYAACHWCHVMAHESFENDTTAALMNELFVNIKVDREERPDLDSIYMQAVQAMTGQGGWPMTVFLTPAGEPFWGGTYFPPDERMGMPSFRRVLTAVSDAYASKPEQIAKSTSAMRDLYRSAAETVPSGTVSAETLRRAADVATRTYDPRHGGFGGAPKFPPTMLLEFLLAHWARTGDRQSLTIAHDTFASMAAGGIHDQIGGGIHRYAVDAHWLVPHFEKMLYDNALLARFGAHLWQATHDDAVRRVTERLLRWVATEMTSPDSGFYASLDADSEGHEGIFYTWTEAELRDVLGDDARPIIEWFGVTAGGNFEGRNILHLPGGINVAEPPELERAMRLLYAVRSARVWPGLDDKIIASWNGLMLRGVATCARVFQSEEWRAFSVRQAECMLRKLVSGETVSRLVPRDGKSVPGFLEDHAAVALGFLEVWQLTGDRAWLDHARALARGIAARFWDESISGFYDVPVDHEALITRPRDLYDNAMPSGSSMAIELFLRLGYITGDETLTQRGEAALRPHTETLARYPQAFGHLLGAADMAVHGMTAVVIVGAEPAATESLRSAASERFLPSGIVAATTVGENADLDLFRDRGARGAAAAYVCRGRVCDAPACTPAELMEQLAGAPLGGTGE